MAKISNPIKENKTLNVVSKEKVSMPDMAKILSKRVDTTIEEIENGYLITKTYEIKYQNKEGESGWHSWCEKTYSEENPIKPSTGTIADYF